MGKFLIVLIILGGAGYYAYSQGWIPGGEQPTDETDSTNPDGQTHPSGGGDLADGGDSTGAPTGPTGLTEAQGQAVAAAEAVAAALSEPWLLQLRLLLRRLSLVLWPLLWLLLLLLFRPGRW